MLPPPLSTTPLPELDRRLGVPQAACHPSTMLWHFGDCRSSSAGAVRPLERRDRKKHAHATDHQSVVFSRWVVSCPDHRLRRRRSAGSRDLFRLSLEFLLPQVGCFWHGCPCCSGVARIRTMTSLGRSRRRPRVYRNSVRRPLRRLYLQPHFSTDNVDTQKKHYVQSVAGQCLIPWFLNTNYLPSVLWRAALGRSCVSSADKVPRPSRCHLTAGIASAMRDRRRVAGGALRHGSSDRSAFQQHAARSLPAYLPTYLPT